MYHLIDRQGMDVVIHSELFFIPEFKAILDKHKRKKSYATEEDQITAAFREISYIFFYIDYRSPFDGMDDDKRHSNAIFNARLTEDWVADKVVSGAISVYQRNIYEVIPTVKSLRTARRGLTSVNDLLEDLVREIENRRMLLQGKKKKAISVEESIGVTKFKRIEKQQRDTAVNEVDTKAILDESISYITKFMALIDKVPSYVLTIENALKQVAKEESDSRPLRGGGKKGAREDVDWDKGRT